MLGGDGHAALEFYANDVVLLFDVHDRAVGKQPPAFRFDFFDEPCEVFQRMEGRLIFISKDRSVLEALQLDALSLLDLDVRDA